MTKRSIFLQSNINNHVTFSLGSVLHADKKQQKRVAISLSDLTEQFTQGFDFKNKAVRNFLYQCEVLLKQDAGYNALKTVEFHVAEADAKSMGVKQTVTVKKAVLDNQFTQLHKLLGRSTKALAIAGASALVLTITAMGLSALPEVGKLGVYVGLGLFAVTLVLGVSAMISHYRSAPVLTREQKEASLTTLALAVGFTHDSESNEKAIVNE